MTVRFSPVLMILVMGVSACAPTIRHAPAPVLSPQGLAQGSMQLTLQQESSILSDVNQITATAVSSDGEVFTGRVVQSIEKTNSDMSNVSWDSSKKTKHGWATTFTDGSQSSVSYRSDAQAVLNGNRGRSMTCDIRFADPSAGIDGGGVGQCRISDGRQVPVQF